MFLLLAGLLSTSALQAAEDLDTRAQALKQRVIDLNRTLMQLEQETLTPVDTQVVVFMAMDEKAPFEPDSVELKLNGRTATRYLYAPRELEAMRQGGVHRLYSGALPEGKHELEVIFNGQGAGRRYLRQSRNLRFVKEAGASEIELRVQADRARPNAPFFKIVELN